MKRTLSNDFFKQLQQYLPGGVSSPVRSFKKVGGDPILIASGEGPYITDMHGKQYIDYVLAFGPNILGHRHPALQRALFKVAQNGFSFGAPHLAELSLARAIIQAFPAMEQVRFTNSGTEATMTAIRLARGYTKRQRIVKFAGCYHGHADAFLVQAGSGALTLGHPDSAGVPQSHAAATIVCQYNDIVSVQQVFAQYGEEIAAVILEPVAGNMGCIPAEINFLMGLRKLCDHYQALLIFDEVMSGFRITYGGAQALYGVYPDLTCLGKIIGGGLPIGAVGGPRHIMEWLAPNGPVYQAGTQSGHPLVMATGAACLREIRRYHDYQKLTHLTRYLAEGLRKQADFYGIPVIVNQVTGMLSLFFTEDKAVNNYTAVSRIQTKQFATFFHMMLAEGIYLPPSPFESLFLSFAHTLELCEQTLSAAEKSYRQVAHKFKLCQ